MKVIVYFFMPLMIISCQADTEKVFAEHSLVGEWEWVRSDGGFAFHIHETPATTSKDIRWVFTDKNVYFIYVNGLLASEGKYLIKRRKCIHSDENKAWIDFSSPSDPDMMIEHIDAEALELSDEMYDGMGSQFRRI